MFSVLLPVFDVAGYVEESVCSVLGQDYADLELIAVDDASTDGGGNRAAPAVTDDRLRLIRLRKNRGPATPGTSPWSAHGAPM